MVRSLRLIGPIERAAHLKRLGALRDVAPANIATIAQLAEEHVFAPGAVVYQSDERVERVHIVVEGRVRVRGGEYGDEVVGEDHVLGLLSLLGREAAGLDAVAESETVTLALSADDVFGGFEDDFAILQNQLRELAEQTLRVRRRIPAGTHLAPIETPPVVPDGEIDLVQRLLHMRRGVLIHANVDGLIALAERMRTVRFVPGDRLWELGAPSGFIYAIITGRVRCTTEDGTEFTCGCGYPLGNLESQCGARRWYTAVAETDVVVLRGDVDGLFDVLEAHTDMAIGFVSGMASALIARRAEMREEAAADVVPSERAAQEGRVT